MSKILKVVGASWLQTKISSYVLGFLGVLAILALFVGQIERIQEDGTYAATVFYSEKTGYRIEYWGQSNELSEIPKGVARAYFRMDIETTGWSILEVETDESYPDEVQAYAAGIVEGALTWYLIHTHLENTIRAKCEDRPIEKQCEKLREAFDKSVNTMKTNAAERGNAEPFWHHVSLYYTQIEGIYTGWKHGVERSEKEYETDISDLYWLNSIAEAIEIQRKLNISLDDSMFDKLPSLSSAFLRIVNETSAEGKDIKKLYVAHNAAGNYSAMTRILKRYKFNYHMTSKDQTPAPGSVIDFSSYPGAISSQDEFYLISGTNNNMAVTGTPLRNYNNKLWKDVNITDEVPLGPRLTAANRIASNVSSWGHILAAHNSGTGSKQWLVVDFKRLEQLDESPQNEAAKSQKVVVESTISEGVKHTVVHRSSNSHFKGLVWLVEQIPGHTHSADISDVLLEQGYWATYGLPFFKNISEITHTDTMKVLYGNVFSESECSRAVMFKLNYKHVKSSDDVIKLMRHNNATAINRVNNETNDCSDVMNCLIDESGYWSVMGARGDVVKTFKEAYGIIDTKLISGTINSTAAVGKKSLEFIAISGPPYTRQNSTKSLYNKGNVASIYTDQFDNEPEINGVEIRDLVKQKQDEKEKEALEILNRDVIAPFQWSKSDYKSDPHTILPDKWAFGPFELKWSW